MRRFTIGAPGAIVARKIGVARRLHERAAMKHAITLALLAFPALAAAQPPGITEATAKRPERTNSINASPWGAALGYYALTYEHLFNGTHGVIVEAEVGLDSTTDASSFRMGGGVGYRWHWRGQQNSGFLGIMFSRTVGSGQVETTSGGETMTHDLDIRSTMVTGNIGKRWMIGDRLNITFRAGLGWGRHVASTSDSDPEAKKAEKKMNDLLAWIPIGLDSELSFGYLF